MSFLKRYRGFLLRWLIGCLIGSVGMAVWAAKHPKPALGAFATPVSFQVTVSGHSYQFTSSALTFTPGTGNNRAVSGVGTFSLVAPGPIPVPTPPPVPVPTPTPLPPPVPIPGPIPVPIGALNVKTFGAVGDGATDDTAAIQKAFNLAVSLPSPHTVFFPPGTYKISDWLKLSHPPVITLLGAGPSSVIHSAAGGGLMIGTGGEPGGPVTVRQLKFTGVPGATQRSGNSTGGIQVFGPANTVVDNCDFASVTSAVFDAAPTQGTITRNCRINGWARIAFFAEKNAQILNCKVIQNDPNPTAQNTSHGVYIHGGASNVLVADCEFSGIAKYALQQYSEAPNTITSGVQMRRLFIHDCQNGIVFAHSRQGAGDIVNSVIDSCTLTNITGGSAILIKDGDGVTVSNNVINGCVSYGIALGVWAPYEQNFSLANVDVSGNWVTGCQVGLMGLASNGGTFSGCSFHGNAVSGNRQNLSIQSVSGLSYSPTGPKPPRSVRIAP